MTKLCCKELQEAIEEEAITNYGRDGLYVEATSYANDGDGHFDEMVNWSREVKFCPFCGKEVTND